MTINIHLEETDNYKNVFRTPCVNKQGLLNAQLRYNLNSESCIRYFFFTHGVHNI